MTKLVHKMNHTTGEHELVPEHWELRLNYMTGRHEFADPNATVQFNPMNDSYSLRTDDASDPRFNFMSGTYELGGDDWELVFDHLEGRYVRRPKE